VDHVCELFSVWLDKQLIAITKQFFEYLMKELPRYPSSVLADFIFKFNIQNLFQIMLASKLPNTILN
jgi:hypothetical protein